MFQFIWSLHELFGIVVKNGAIHGVFANGDQLVRLCFLFTARDFPEEPWTVLGGAKVVDFELPGLKRAIVHSYSLATGD